MKKTSIVGTAILLCTFVTSLSYGQCNINPGNVATNGPIEINYNPNGTWNRSNPLGGVLGIKFLGTDFSAPGNPWQQVTIGFNGQEIKGNYSGGSWDWVTPAGVDIYSGSCFGSITTWFVTGQKGERFCVVKQERMCKGDTYIKMKFSVTNLGDVPLQRFSLIHGVDPDQDIQNFSLFPTRNDVVQQGHLAKALGVKSGLTIAYGLCDSFRQQVGFTNWSTAATPTLYDPNGNYSDITVHCITRYDVIDAFQSRTFKFFVLFNSRKSRQTIEELYKKAVNACCCCCDLSKEIKLPDGPPNRGIIIGADAALVEAVKERVLSGEESPELKELLPILAAPANREEVESDRK